jgi:hypothetical protein
MALVAILRYFKLVAFCAEAVDINYLLASQIGPPPDPTDSATVGDKIAATPSTAIEAR